MILEKPPELFGRDAEWDDLATFASDPTAGATLAIVYGRRRQGKTLLLELLAEQTAGFYFPALEQSSAQNLTRLGLAYGAFSGIGAPVAFSSWQQAVDALFSLGERGAPLTVVLDEVPYLLKDAPELPSILQAALNPRGRARQRSRSRLILCGSAFSVMRGLLDGTAPLRGRASREVVLAPFDYREAARFWGVAGDPTLAVMLDSLIGGTPGYRDFSTGEPPTGEGFGDWVVRNPLNPSSAFFREGRILLAEEPQLTDRSLYFSVLAAIADGRTTRSQIAAAIGRKETALAHPLKVLEDARLVMRRDDVLRRRRGTFHLCEPMLRFHQLVVAPNEARLQRRQGERVWEAVADTVEAKIYGPHFEELCREWTARFASPDALGGTPDAVGTTRIGCPEHRVQHEVDVVAVAHAPHEGDRVLVVGEAKWQRQPVGAAQLDRLVHLRRLLGAEGARLALFARAGFTRELAAEAAGREDVLLVDPDRLYRGA